MAPANIVCLTCPRIHGTVNIRLAPGVSVAGLDFSFPQRTQLGFPPFYELEALSYPAGADIVVVVEFIGVEFTE